MGLIVGVALLLLVAAGAAVFLLAPGLLGGQGDAPTTTPQVLVAQSFVARDVEIVVPGGASAERVDQAFAAAYLQLARLDCGCEAQLAPDSLVYLDAPSQIGIGADGARYRASLQGTILVPQP
jgi:hypothetical protein